MSEDTSDIYPGRVYWESDGDKCPLDVYLCQSGGTERLCEFRGESGVGRVLAARRIAAVVNATRQIQSMKLLEGSPKLLLAATGALAFLDHEAGGSPHSLNIRAALREAIHDCA